jgi:aldehyde:ferredoxin oxidoreductase
MSYGYAGKILRLNLSNRWVGTMDTAQYERWVGGHGLGSAIFWDLCPDKTISGFDPRNVITIMAGPMAGTLSPGSTRCEMQGIGPQGYPIEWFTRSNFGGRFAAQLKYAGWDGIVIEGRAEAPVWVNIVNDQVTIEDAKGLWGLGTRKTQEEIWSRVTGGAYTKQKPAVLCIGQAGEHLSRIGTVMHDAGWAAGQGGFGGAWGAKNLKAIGVVGTGGVKVADPRALMAAWLWHKTNFQFNVDDPRHESPRANFSDYWDINRCPGNATITPIAEPCRPKGCQGCPVACSRRAASGLANEAHCFSTAWPFVNIFPPEAAESRMSTGEWSGSLLEPLDISQQFVKDRSRVTDLANDYGLNIYDLFFGDVYLITLYAMGILGPGQTIHCDLPFDRWATAEFKEAYLKMIAYREGIGDTLAEGLARAAERWGRFKDDTETGLLPYPHWGYSEHNNPRVEVDQEYATVLGERDSNDHSLNHPCHQIPRVAKVAGVEPIVSAERMVEILSQKVLPFQGDPFMFDNSEGPTGIYSASRAKTIAWLRRYSRFWKDSVGYCDFLWPNFIDPNAPDMLGYTPEGEPRFLNAVTGKGISFIDGMEIGRRIWNLDRAIWVVQGRHRDMEVFAPYVYSVPSPRPNSLPVYEDGEWKYSGNVGRTLDRARFEEWKTKYYELEGWDKSSGWHTRRTLEELGLAKVADELQSRGKLGV